MPGSSLSGLPSAEADPSLLLRRALIGLTSAVLLAGITAVRARQLVRLEVRA